MNFTPNDGEKKKRENMSLIRVLSPYDKYAKCKALRTVREHGKGVLAKQYKVGIMTEKYRQSDIL